MPFLCACGNSNILGRLYYSHRRCNRDYLKYRQREEHRHHEEACCFVDRLQTVFIRVLNSSAEFSLYYRVIDLVFQYIILPGKCQVSTPLNRAQCTSITSGTKKGKDSISRSGPLTSFWFFCLSYHPALLQYIHVELWDCHGSGHTMMSKTEMILDFLAFASVRDPGKKYVNTAGTEIINCSEGWGMGERTQGPMKENNRKNTAELGGKASLRKCCCSWELRDGKD